MSYVGCEELSNDQAPGVSNVSSVQDDKRKRKRRPKPGDTAALRRLLWNVLQEAEKVTESDNPEIKLKAASTCATLGGTYLKVLEQHDLAQEVAELREEVRDIKAARSDDIKA
jgi:hypothetical protein